MPPSRQVAETGGDVGARQALDGVIGDSSSAEAYSTLFMGGPSPVKKALSRPARIIPVKIAVNPAPRSETTTLNINAIVRVVAIRVSTNADATLLIGGPPPVKKALSNADRTIPIRMTVDPAPTRSSMLAPNTVPAMVNISRNEYVSVSRVFASLPAFLT